MEREIKLTLDSTKDVPELKIDDLKDEPKMPANEIVLSEDEMNMVDAFAKSIDLKKTNEILEYGSGAQTQIANFSEKTLNQVKTKDLGEVGKMLGDIVNELKSFDIDEKEKGLGKLFKKTSNKVTALQTKYQSVEKNVEDISKNLEAHQVTLMKDIATMDQMYELNSSYYKELSMYIMAGKKKIEEAKTVELAALEKEAEETNSPSKIQEVKDFRESIHRFEKKLHDLDLTRMISLQMAPQIRMIQAGNTVMVEKIQSTIVNTIPLWKSQMVLAMGSLHTSQAAKAQRTVTELTNDLLRKNAEALHQASVETTRAAEESLIDVETIKYTNDQLISALKEVRQIQEDGVKKRLAAADELQKLENELKTNLMKIARGEEPLQ